MREDICNIKNCQETSILSIQGDPTNQQKQILQFQEENRQGRRYTIYLSGNPKISKLKKFKLKQLTITLPIKLHKSEKLRDRKYEQQHADTKTLVP